MTIEDVLETDHFIPNSQPSAPSHNIPLPKKSVIRVTRIPILLMSLIPFPSQAPIDFGIPNEPADDFNAQTADPVTASIDFGIHNEPTNDFNAPANVLTTAQAAVRPSKVSPSTSAQTDQIEVSPSTSAQAAHDVEILDFYNIISDLPKNVYTEFYDVFPVVQPKIKY